MICLVSSRPLGRPTASTPAWASARLLACVLTPFLALAASGLPALAGESAPERIAGAEVRLLSAGGGGPVREAGIEIRLDPHWKTYWRYPGDSGVPPVASFEQSQNVRAVAMSWPAPRRFSDGADGFSVGYKSSLVFPLTVTLEDPAAPATLELALDFAVCEALCIPAHARLSLDLAPAPDPSAAQRIAAARAKVPEETPLAAAGAPAILSARLDTAASPPQLVVEARVATPKADLFVEGPNENWALPLPQKLALPDGIARFTLPLEGVPPGADVARTSLRFTLADTPRSITTTAVPTPP